MFCHYPRLFERDGVVMVLVLSERDEKKGVEGMVVDMTDG
jgi:hypothetical protein